MGGRVSRKRKKALNYWLSEKPMCDDLRFIRVGNSFLLSKKVHSLPANARYLYLCMTMEAGGCRDFTFTRSTAAKYGISSATLVRNLELLKNSGFISCVEQNRNLRKPNVYRFSATWREQ